VFIAADPDGCSCFSFQPWPKPTARRLTCRRASPSWSAGYNVEYSAMTFALFFLGEYMNMILMSAYDDDPCSMGGWLPPFNLDRWRWNW
jgi:hypothetical protein